MPYIARYEGQRPVHNNVRVAILYNDSINNNIIIIIIITIIIMIMVVVIIIIIIIIMIINRIPQIIINRNSTLINI